MTSEQSIIDMVRAGKLPPNFTLEQLCLSACGGTRGTVYAYLLDNLRSACLQTLVPAIAGDTISIPRQRSRTEMARDRTNAKTIFRIAWCINSEWEVEGAEGVVAFFPRELLEHQYSEATLARWACAARLKAGKRGRPRRERPKLDHCKK